MQHLIKGDRVKRLAQGQVDADQHHPQLVIGEHHAYRQRSQGLPPMSGSQGLQHFGVPGIAVVRRASQGQRLLVQRRGHQRVNVPAQGGLRRPDHAFGSHAAGAGADCTHGHQWCRGHHLQDGQAARRQPARILWRIQHGYRQKRLTRGDLLCCAPQGGHVARHKTGARQLRRVAKGLGDDLRPNAGWVTQCDGDQGQVGLWHG